ncbi:hypothetical protein [Lactobacillus sp. Sy-1]|uniref:hypothetical protein n=1 Tax=Lactobacillus sp. Sy-1 TaxID=2109645 RepID=UPI001C5A718B|nr:hypothetical protein [Lactobacillus sp. Sy-1]MBW1606202.1 hypothetical protein [Lactobacillus sp. Sy-1]
MNQITGYEMAKTVEREMTTRFSLLKTESIEIDPKSDNPQIKINLVHKLDRFSVQMTLIAERQENNVNNIHFTLFNNDPFFTNLYHQQRSEYVKRSHQLAEAMDPTALIPENLYLVQSADGLPGVDFIKLTSFVDAVNLILTISNLFKNQTD